MRRSIFFTMLLAFTAGSLTAQDVDVVGLSAVTDPAVVEPGQSGELLVRFTIAPGYHVGDTSDGFFKVNVTPSPGVDFSEPVYPESIKDPYGDYYKGSITVTVPFTAAPDAEAGARRLQIKAGFQPCSEEGVCYMPDEGSVTAQLKIEGAAGTVPPAAASAEAVQAKPGGMAAKLTGALEKGSLAAFIIVFLGGMLTSLTPCVYPMIPITIAVIGAQSQGGRLKGFVLSLFYVLGLAATFTTLGVAAAKTGALFGSVTRHPAAILVISLIFLVMGLSMLGLFTIRVPASMATKLQSKKRSGFLGSFLTGLVAGLVVSPCVSPLLVVILAWVAQTGSVLMGAGLLFSFSLGLGVLFILIGTFSGILKSLPKSGGWMEIVERGFGILLVGIALVFLRPLLPLLVYQMVWAAGLILTAEFFGAFSPRLPEAGTGAKVVKAAGIMAAMTAFALIFFSLLSAYGTTAMPGSAVPVQQAADQRWLSSEDEAFRLAAEDGRPVLIDFYADWCAACHELDEKTWPAPEVRRLLDEYAALKLDFTANSDADKTVQKKYGVIGLPTVIVVTAQGEEKGRFEGFQPPDVVAAFLKKHM